MEIGYQGAVTAAMQEAAMNLKGVDPKNPRGPGHQHHR